MYVDLSPQGHHLKQLATKSRVLRLVNVGPPKILQQRSYLKLKF